MFTCLTAVRPITILSGTAFEMGLVGGSGITNLKTKLLKIDFLRILVYLAYQYNTID